VLYLSLPRLVQVWGGLAGCTWALSQCGCGCCKLVGVGWCGTSVLWLCLKILWEWVNTHVWLVVPHSAQLLGHLLGASQLGLAFHTWLHLSFGQWSSWALPHLAVACVGYVGLGVAHLAVLVAHSWVLLEPGGGIGCVVGYCQGVSRSGWAVPHLGFLLVVCAGAG
jgi:hypothetical protein